uniref:MD-2-related lipid-recognition domain-containing protein n=1 Tax=Strigamia maritima TaxID=126957 RepID=T1IP49_STRMM
MLTNKIYVVFLVFTVCEANFGHGEQSVSFSWDNCGTGEQALIKELTLSPTPLIIPGNVTIDFVGESAIDAVSPLKTQLTMKRKLGFFWIDIPCVDDLGSCNYDDGCTLLEKYFPVKDPCPPVFLDNNIPCHCPFPKGEYKIPSYTVDIPSDPLPSWLSDGQYKIRIEISPNYACVDLSLTLGSSNPSVNLIV